MNRGENLAALARHLRARGGKALVADDARAERLAGDPSGDVTLAQPVRRFEDRADRRGGYADFRCGDHQMSLLARSQLRGDSRDRVRALDAELNDQRNPRALDVSVEG